MEITEAAFAEMMDKYIDRELTIYETSALIGYWRSGMNKQEIATTLETTIENVEKTITQHISTT